MTSRIILASGSSRRQELLKECISQFEVVVPQVEELKYSEAGNQELARQNSILKADATASAHPDAWVIGSDTVVSLDGKSFGKPSSLDEAREMLLKLSGKTHDVLSGIALINQSKSIQISEVVSSRVIFYPLTDTLMDDYLMNHDPTQFAGAYPIQYTLGTLVAGYEGSYKNIVGLPVERLTEILKENGVTPS